MDQILRHIMIPAADEYFIAGDKKCPIILGDGFGADGPHITARLGFSQNHTALVFPRINSLQIFFLLLISAEKLDDFPHTMGQTAVNSQRLIGRKKQIPGDEIDRQGQLLSPQLIGFRRRSPPGGTEFFISPMIGRGNCNSPFIIGSSDFIPFAVDRIVFIHRQFLRCFNGHFEGFFRMVPKTLILKKLRDF